MFKFDYNYPGYLIGKIRRSIDSKKEIFPNKQDFCLAICEIYFSNKPMKLVELSDVLAHYYFKKNKHIDYLKAFEESLNDLNAFAQRADNSYNFKNGEIQGFCNNSIKEVSRFN